VIPLLYFVLTTGRCNLECRYCGGSFPPDVVPWEIKYPLSSLVRFLEQDPDPVVAFYGGEPLLNPQPIREIMDSVHWARFVVQTNGTLMEALPKEYWLRFDTILLSIDGVPEVTDYYRGRGVYGAVLRAAARLREWGYRGDLVARMTLSELGDVYRDVLHLLSLGLFDHVHWQLDVIWSDRWRNFDEWVERVYKPGLAELIDYWIGELEEGRVPGIAPFQAIAYAYLSGRGLPSPPCEAGSSAFAISTDGRILACPIAVYEKWAEVGHVETTGPRDLKRLKIGEPCTDCGYFSLCGGRCLYAYFERLWGEEGFEKVCSLTRYLIDLLLEKIAEIEGGVLALDDLRYPEFNNTVEIIP